MAHRRWIILALASVLLGTGAWFGWTYFTGVEVGNVRINPYAKIDPAQTYRVVVWDYEVPLPWSNVSHRSALTEAIDELHRQYPNIEVSLVLRNWEEGDGPLRDTIAAGNPPDILGMPNGIRIYSTDYQVPLERFLPAAEQTDLFAAARHAATQEHLWAFPRWINVSRWVIRTDRWPGQKSFSLSATEPPTLTAAQWEEGLANARTKTGSSAMAANLLDPAVFRDLMISATGKTFFGPDGKVQWSEESIRNVAGMLQTWVEKGLLPSDIESAARNRLARFWTGTAPALAPTTPWLLHHIMQRSGMLASPDGDPGSPVITQANRGRLEKTERSLFWTIPPVMRSEPAVAATVSGYAVFRQAQYQGDDHTQAAATVARFLSRKMGLWEASRLFAVPAYPSAIPDWLATARMPEADMQALLTWSAAAVTAPLDDTLIRLEERIMAETALPGLIQVLKKQTTPEQFARDLVNTPISASTEVAVP